MKKDIFTDEYESLMEILKQYNRCDKQFIQSFMNKVVYEQFGRSGEYLHRGYYSPSRLMDTISANCNRGKLLKRKTSKKPDFIYGFDENDRLVFVKQTFMQEVIMYEDKMEIGIAYDKYREIETISKSYYDEGKVQSYVYALCNPYREEITEINTEKYSYLDDKIIVDRYHYYENGIEVRRHKRYIFAIEDGYMKSYTIEEYDGDRMKDSVWNGHIWEVSPPRKVWF